MIVTRTPQYRKQKSKPRARAFVELDGRRHYLGAYGTSESKQRYHQLLAERTASDRQLPLTSQQLTVVELVARFWKHIETYYRKPNGKPTASLYLYQAALRPLKLLYGRAQVADFGPKALRVVRNELLKTGISRGVINKYTNLIRGMFRWGVSQELVVVEVYTALTTVDGLRRGRCGAKEIKPIKPVPEAHVEAAQAYVSRQVWALIQLQLHTAARGGELVMMRAIDIDTAGTVWMYGPADHKTAHHGHKRTVYIGPRAQQIIGQFMADRPVDAYLFSPGEAQAQRRAQAPTHRRPDQQPNPHKTDRVVGDHYTTDSYRRAIERACRKAGVPVWTPHRLRHNAATFIRREYGIEAAQIMLGHARADVTQIYAEVNQEKAITIAEKIG